MSLPIAPNVRFAIHRPTSLPPSAAAASDVPGYLEGAYDRGLEQAEATSDFRYTHVLLVAGDVDARDDFQEFTRNSSGRDRVCIPDGTGTGFDVVFVEKVPGGIKRLYLQRRFPPWPTTDL